MKSRSRQLSRLDGWTSWKAISVAAAIAGLTFFIYWIRPFTGPSLNWTDRRPIASLMLCRSGAGWEHNPRGWFNDASLNVATATGRAAFQKQLLALADQSIAIMHTVGAQGMIGWDLEGGEFPHKISYIGDPRLVEELAPEMAGVVDTFFMKFRSAGFRVGLTIRPQQFQVLADGTAVQKNVSDPAALLISKIRYARQRWGATLFYVDSNQTAYVPMRTAVLKRVLEEMPDILLIPEHSIPFDYGAAAPYSDLKKPFPFTPAFYRSIYPHAFGVINTADGHLEAHRDELTEAVLHGDVLLFRGWFSEPADTVIRDLYTK